MNALAIKLAAGAALMLALFGAGHHLGARSVHRDWDAEKLATAQAANKAVAARVASNTALETKQAATNTAITKAHDEEIAHVRTAIAARRVRVGPAICAGSAAPTEAPRASGSDGADPTSRVVREDLERDLRALEIRVEEALATGRTCQAFVTESERAP